MQPRDLRAIVDTLAPLAKDVPLKWADPGLGPSRIDQFYAEYSKLEDDVLREEYERVYEARRAYCLLHATRRMSHDEVREACAAHCGNFISSRHPASRLRRLLQEDG
eukprot:791205-Prymnesium_polylepis.1